MPVHGYNIHRIKQADLKPLLDAIDSATLGEWPADLDVPENQPEMVRDLKSIRQKLLTRGPSISMNRSERESLWQFAYAWASAYGGDLLNIAQRLWNEPRPTDHDAPTESKLSRLYNLSEAVTPLNDGEMSAIKQVVGWVVAASQKGVVPPNIAGLAREISTTLAAASSSGPRRSRIP